MAGITQDGSGASSSSHLAAPFAPIGPGNERGVVVVLTLIFIFLASLVFGLQLSIVWRKDLLKRTWREESLLALSWALSVATGACLIAAAQRAHYGDPAAMSALDTAQQSYRYHIAILYLSVASQTLAKLACVRSIMTMMKPRGVYRVCTWLTVGLAAVYALYTVIVVAVEAWTSQSDCGSDVYIKLASWTLNMVSELTLIVLPIPIVLQVRFPLDVRRVNRTVIITGFSMRTLVIALQLGAIFAAIKYPHWCTQAASSIWLAAVTLASVLVTSVPTSMSFIRLIASGAMGARIGDTQLQTIGTSSEGSRGWSRKFQMMREGEGTVTVIQGGAGSAIGCAHGDAPPRLSGALDDCVTMRLDVSVESEAAARV